MGQFTLVLNLTPAFTATIVAPSGGLDMVLNWDTTRTGIPGINVPSTFSGVTNIYSYFGNVSASETTIQGAYGASPSQTVGTWSATRLAGLGPAIAGVINAASGVAGPIAPGEIISIFANPDTNPIGPTNALGLQLDNSGKVATTLGGVQVHFLPVDAYAPLTFVGAGQINAVVPNAVSSAAYRSVP